MSKAMWSCWFPPIINECQCMHYKYTRTMFHLFNFITSLPLLLLLSSLFSVETQPKMGMIRLQSVILSARKFQSIRNKNQSDVPKGHLAVYVGETQRRRFVVPITYLNHPSFKDLLRRAEEEFGYDYPTGCLTIPCTEAVFLNLTAKLHFRWKKCRIKKFPDTSLTRV